MPKVSNRAQQTQASPFRKLAGLALEAEAKGKKIHYLNIGQPDIKTPLKAIEAVRQNKVEIVKYAPAQGIPSYRKALVKYYAQNDIHISYDEVVVSSGASEAIQFLLLACLEKGEEVIVPEPLYANYVGFASMSDVCIQPVSSHIEDGFALPGIDAFKAAIGPKTRAILICNPNNPTGAVYNRKALEEIGSLALEHDLFLFVDEVYREFCYDEEPFCSALNLTGMDKHVVVIDSISKRFSACGARVGAVVSRNSDVLAMYTRFAQLRLSAPIYGQLLAEAALSDPTEYLEDVKAEYRRRRDYLVDRLQAMQGVICHTPKGAFYAFIELPIEDSEHFTEWLVRDFEHKGQTLMISPGPGFYATPGMGQRQVRIAYVRKVEDLKLAMDCLEAALEAYPGYVGQRAEKHTAVAKF
ncbi:MAG: pyridoxal phosphate-dependent aminotransferase [Bacteroidota bacterium]